MTQCTIARHGKANAMPFELTLCFFQFVWKFVVTMCVCASRVIAIVDEQVVLFVVCWWCYSFVCFIFAALWFDDAAALIVMVTHLMLLFDLCWCGLCA